MLKLKSLFYIAFQITHDFIDANLLVMKTLRKEFDIPIGFSDHSIGSAIPIAAVALGADVIEKHFTLNINAQGLDHALSADPSVLSSIVEGVRWRICRAGRQKKS